MARAKKTDSETKVWKIIAIVMMAAFLCMIVFGIIRAYEFRPHCRTAPQQKLDMAQRQVGIDLHNHNESIDTYKQFVFNRTQRIMQDDTSKEVIQISLYNGSTIHYYLIDANTGQIVMHTETQYSGWMANMSMGMPERNMPMPQGGC